MQGSCRSRHLDLKSIARLASEVYRLSLATITPRDDAAQLLEASRVQALTVYRKIRGSCLERRTAESAQLAFEIASMEPLGRGSLALAVAALLESLALNRLHVDPDEALNALEKSLSLGDVEYLRRSIAAMAADGRVRGEARV